MISRSREGLLAAQSPRAKSCMDPFWALFGYKRSPKELDPAEILETQLNDQIRRLQVDDKFSKSGNRMDSDTRREAEAEALSTMTSIRAAQVETMQALRKEQRISPKMLQRLEREYREEIARINKLKQQLQPTTSEVISQQAPSLRSSPAFDGISGMSPSPDSTRGGVTFTDHSLDGWWVACEDSRAQILTKFDRDLEDMLQALRRRCERTRDEVSALFQARIREAQYQHQRDNLQDNYHDFRRELELRKGQLLHDTKTLYQRQKEGFLAKVDQLKVETSAWLRKVGEELQSSLESSKDMAFDTKQKLYTKKMQSFSKMMEKAVEKQMIVLAKQYVDAARRKVNNAGGSGHEIYK